MSTLWRSETHNAVETQALAAQLGEHLSAGDVLWLSGELGAGKTTFTQGLGRGLRIREPINSPTFVLMRVYQGRLPLYHIDLYRLDTLRDIENLGLRDYLEGEGVCVLEWAERLDPQATQSGLHIRLTVQDAQTRMLAFSACGARAAQLLHDLQTFYVARD